MTDIKVSLPTPCHESWEAMAPRGCNRHCASCDTIIHDLSSMTVGQAEALLDSSERICVRASVNWDGTVRTTNPSGRPSRRMVATIGTAVLLATAACQSVALSPVSPRFEIVGQLKQGSWATTALLTSSAGKNRSFELGRDRRFRFGNLHPGTYTLSFAADCGPPSVFGDVVVSENLNLADVEVNEDEFCIVVGMIQRVNAAEGS